MQSTATIKTVKAERYLTLLCKHFCHKVPAKFEGSIGWVELPMGRVDLEASDQDLTFKLESDCCDQLTQLEDIMQRHLERFAFREDLAIFWRRMNL